MDAPQIQIKNWFFSGEVPTSCGAPPQGTTHMRHNESSSLTAYEGRPWAGKKRVYTMFMVPLVGALLALERAPFVIFNLYSYCKWTKWSVLQAGMNQYGLKNADRH